MNDLKIFFWRIFMKFSFYNILGRDDMEDSMVENLGCIWWVDGCITGGNAITILSVCGECAIIYGV